MDSLDPTFDSPGASDDWRTRARAALRRPLALAIFGVVMIGLIALLYLHQVAALASANDHLAALQAERARLERQDADQRARLGAVTNPAYVDERARALGLVPAPLGSALIVSINQATLSALRDGGQP